MTDVFAEFEKLTKTDPSLLAPAQRPDNNISNETEMFQLDLSTIKTENENLKKQVDDLRQQLAAAMATETKPETKQEEKGGIDYDSQSDLHTS